LIKFKFGSIEIMGYIGGLLWGAIIAVRLFPLPTNEIYRLIIGIAPNLGAAWIVTMFSKWVVIFALKQNYTVKQHAVICVCIVILALASEFIHDAFLGSPFDVYDMIITIVAQLCMFAIPIISKDQYFENYT